MNTPRFDPAIALAEGFARQMQTWSLQLGAAAAAAQAAGRAARALSLASSQGHVCWPLALIGEVTPALLWGSRVVGTALAPGRCPVVLDEDERLYLHRDFDHERALARRLLQAARREATAPPWPDGAAALLHSLFPATAPSAEGQRLATALALRQRLLVISGGPGTGKTTTVVKLLALLLATQPGCRIALAAPTGKAAARMAQALRERSGDLPEAMRAALPTRAATVHRLLGAGPTPGSLKQGFKYHANNPLPIDTLVVDEASMLDLALARRLLDAVPPHARIILLGDKDQLAAVESGAVFSDLSASPALSEAARADLALLLGLPLPAGSDANSTLPDSVVWLTHNHRFAAGSAIGRLATAIQQGQVEAVTELLLAGGSSDVQLLPQGQQAWDTALAGYGPYIDTLLHHPGDAAAAHRAFGQFRLLCALRSGAFGVEAANQRLGGQVRLAVQDLQPASAAMLSPWYAGRPVMVLRNEPSLGLFNGDIGICLAAEESSDWQVWFADSTQPEGLRAIAAARLPAHETCFAMTVHKAQGSEFECVMVWLPAPPSRVLTRELLYTAVTRARSQVLLAAPLARVADAVATPTQRHSGLQARLREAASEQKTR